MNPLNATWKPYSSATPITFHCNRAGRGNRPWRCGIPKACHGHENPVDGYGRGRLACYREAFDGLAGLPESHQA